MAVIEVVRRPEHGAFTAVIGSTTDTGFGVGEVLIQPPCRIGQEVLDWYASEGNEVRFQEKYTTEDASLFSFAVLDLDHVPENADLNANRVKQLVDLILEDLGQLNKSRFSASWNKEGN